ncbi:hypothetical protein [Arthrobacter sp. PsM3]|nr:hypothetical protein [Arthrobacter sp. PsM3]MDN4646037.1 hypothetical protein [Arthrobacter sp. PsM3]
MGIGKAVFGAGELITTFMLGAGWAINLTVAEFISRRNSGARIRRPCTGS